MRDKYGAIVIGGGYFGCAAAYHLAKAGVSTLLLEAGEITRGASGANFGNVQVQDASMGLSLELTLKGWHRMEHMEEELGCDIGYAPQPSIIAAECPAHLPELEKHYREKKEAGLDIRWLEGEALHEAEPAFAPGSLVAATWFEQGKIYPFHYMYALIRVGRHYGLEVAEHTPVASLLLEGGTCTGVMLSNGTTVRADHVVVAAGSGARGLCATAGLDVPVYSVKAEAFVTEAVAPLFRTYYSSAAFFAEAHSQEGASTSLCVGQSHYGNILLAETCKPHTSVDQAGQDLVSPEHCRNMYEKIARFLPCIQQVNLLRSWTTASPYTDTCLPCLGKSTVPGLILDTGFKSAAVMSAVAGEIVADLVCKDSCQYDLSEFIGQVRPLAKGEN